MTVPADAIDLVVAGGPGLGFGHVMRVGALAREGLRQGLPVRLFLHGDDTARQRLAEAAGLDVHGRWDDWPADLRARLVVLDLPGEKATWLERAERAGVPVAVLDDSRYFERARLTICPGLHEPPIETEHLVAGPRFSVLSRTHLGTARRPLAERHDLLLSLGGADPHRATLRVAPILERLLDDPALPHSIRERHVVLGPGFQEADAAEARLSGEGWIVHRALPIPDMAQRMASTRIAVMGFGTSLAELAWLGVPHLSITHHAFDDGHARRLETLGIGRHLGFAPELDPDLVETRLRDALVDGRWQLDSARRALEALEGGRGTARIIERLASLASPSRAPRSPSRSEADPGKGTHVSPR